MHFGKRIVLAVLLLPAAEIVTFLVVAWLIGFFSALALMVLTSLAGAFVLRHAGRGRIAQLRGAVRSEQLAAEATQGGGLAWALAGILLLLPGFITDLLGAGLLVTPIRRWLGSMVGRAMVSQRRQSGAGSVVDLAPDEWRAVPERELPKQRNKPRTPNGA